MSLFVASLVIVGQVIPPVRAPKKPNLPGLPHRVIGVFGPSALDVSFFGDTGGVFRARRGRYGASNQPQRRVLLYGISTPRMGQDGYAQGLMRLENWVQGAAVADLEAEPLDRFKTHRGADVRYVWVWGKLLNFELVRAGWARVNEEGRAGKYGELLTAAENEARRLRVGLWR